MRHPARRGRQAIPAPAQLRESDPFTRPAAGCEIGVATARRYVGHSCVSTSPGQQGDVTQIGTTGVLGRGPVRVAIRHGVRRGGSADTNVSDRPLTAAGAAVAPTLRHGLRLMVTCRTVGGVDGMRVGLHDHTTAESSPRQ